MDQSVLKFIDCTGSFDEFCCGCPSSFAEATGVLFEQASPAAMANALAALEHNVERFDPEKIRQHALNFDSSVFLEKFIDLVEQILKA